METCNIESCFLVILIATEITTAMAVIVNIKFIPWNEITSIKNILSMETGNISVCWGEEIWTSVTKAQVENNRILYALHV